MRLSKGVQDNSEQKEDPKKDLKEKDTQETASLSKAGFSLVGLIVVGLLVYYALPDVTKALKALITGKPKEELVVDTGKESAPEHDNTEGDKIEESVAKDDKVVEGDINKEEEQKDSLSSLTILDFKSKVKKAMEESLRPKARNKGEFFLSTVRVAKNRKKLSVDYELYNEKKIMFFYHSDEYEGSEVFVAEYDDEKFDRKNFSSQPTFSVSD